MELINFDNSATSFPKPASVRDAVMKALTVYGGNPGRGGHRLSIETAAAVYGVRSAAADFFGAQPDNVVFTLNCTHALNMAIKGVLSELGGGHIIISSLEHNSAARPVHALSLKGECDYSIAKVSEDDLETVHNIKSLVKPNTRIVAFTLGSNVTGRILPFVEIGKLCAERNICFIADGAQTCGVIPVKLSDGINIICASGHKSLYGATGTGLLITDGAFRISPLIQGGTGSSSLELNQSDILPDSLESGTVNVAGIMSLGAGLRFIQNIGMNNIRRHEQNLCDKFIKGVSTLGAALYRGANANLYLPVASFNINGYTSNETASLLSDRGFALRGGLHCAGLAHKSLGTEQIGTVRFSPSFFNSEREVDALLSVLEEISKGRT